MSNIARAKVVATLRDLARQAASAADRLERDASPDPWAHEAPSYADHFAMSDIGARFARGEIGESEARARVDSLRSVGFTKAEVSERNEGLRCAMLLAERALSAVHCLARPGAPYLIETNARAACAGWEAVAKADVLPLNPGRTPMSEPDPKDREAASLLFALLWEVRHVYGECVGRPHEDYNVRALLWGAHWPSFRSRMTGPSRSAVPYVPGNGGVFGRFHEVFPGGNPIPEAEAIALLAVMHRNPGKGRVGVPERFAEFLAAWRGLDNANGKHLRPILGRPDSTPAQRLAEAVLRASIHGGKRMAVTPYTERQRKKSQKNRGKVRAAPRT